MQSDNVKPFINSALLTRIQRSPGQEHAANQFLGAALFADISAYTVLAERLCEDGAEGLERLAMVLDQAFNSYLGHVAATGGEVGCFAGDALLAYWPAREGGLKGAIDQAQRCARALHATSWSAPPAGCSVPRLHIGVGAGPLWAAWLGGVDGHWLPLLAGDAVRDACGACRQSAAGQSLLSPAAHKLAGATGDRDTTVPNAQQLNPESSEGRTAKPAAGIGDDPAELNGLIPRVVREWSDERYVAWLPKLRSVCSLFVCIDGLNDNAPDALERHQAAVAAIMMAARRYSGSRGTLILEEKGLVFELCLGLPHDAHPDDALRAVKAGLAIDAALNGLGLACTAGIAAGRAVCTAIGAPQHRQYMAIGRVKHIAARLMEKARSGLVCSAEVADLVRDEVDLIAQPAAELKGITPRIRLFRARSAADPVDFEEALLEREAEQQSLTERLDALSRGRGAVLWCYGDAGIGKTALIQHLTRAAASQGITCVTGGAESVEQPVSYRSWRPIYASLLGVSLDAVATPKRVETAGRWMQDPPNPELAPLINAVLPGLLEESPAVAALSAKARGDATLNVLSGIIRAAAGRPLLLVLEDCHWMDSASWRLVRRVAEDCPQVLLVLTSRPALEGTDLVALRQRENFHEMTLQPLSRESIGQLVGNLLDGGTAAPAVIDEVARRSAGNPLFAREYTLLLRASGRLTLRDGEWRMAASAVLGHTGEALPLTVEGAITSRLDSLPPEDELAIKAASVLGERFEIPLLRRLLGDVHDANNLDTVLSRLITDQLIKETSQADYAVFQHALIREAAYAQLTPKQKRALHQAAADGIEALHAEHLAPHFAVLAHHWSMADVPEPAVRYAELAAAQALTAGAYLEADRLLRVCLDLTEQQGRVPSDQTTLIHWHVALAEASQGLGRIEERGAEARSALALAGRAQPQSRTGLVFLAGARAFKAYLHGARRRDAGGRPELARDLAQAHRHSAAACFFANDPVAMMCDTVAAVERAQTVAPCADLADAYAELGGLLGIAGLRRIGERLLRRAIEVGMATGDSSASAYAHLINSLYAVGVGNWRVADHSADLAQELFLPLGDWVNWGNAQAVRFWLNHYQAQSELAESAARALQDRAQKTGNRQHQAWALRFLALCDLRRREPEAAAERLENALECLGDSAALNDQIPTLGALALARLRMGRVGAARGTAQRGLELVSRVRLPLVHSTLEGYAALAEVALAGWRESLDGSHWRRAARHAIRGLRRYRYAFPIGEPYYQLWRGHFFELGGRQRAAARSFRRGRDGARRLGMLRYEARCAQALAATSPQSG